jgi:hypothetical protein
MYITVYTVAALVRPRLSFAFTNGLSHSGSPYSPAPWSLLVDGNAR